MKPIIGVVPLWDETKDSMWMLPGYMKGIEIAGGIPIMLPLTDQEDNLQILLDTCAGILITGGHDVSPKIYGESARYDNVICCPERDAMESTLLRLALEKDKPILGICRGIQMINAYLGGTLYQDLPKEYSSAANHNQKAPYDQPIHGIELIPDSPLQKLLGKNQIEVNSLHHQNIKDIAPELEIMAVAEDGLIEAVYMPSKTFLWAVQWHPEFSYVCDEDSKKIFQAFIDSIKKGE